MTISTVNISFQGDLLNRIDQMAKGDSRSRSEFIREAVRMYIERKQKWQDIFERGQAIAIKQDISEADILKEIKKYRKSKS